MASKLSIILIFAAVQADVPFDTGWDVHVNVCIKTQYGNETVGCVTCSPCILTSPEVSWLQQCHVAYMDCVYLCNLREPLKWTDETLRQEYIEILASPCHYVKPVTMNATEEAHNLKTSEITSTEVTIFTDLIGTREISLRYDGLSLKVILVITGVSILVVLVLCGVLVVCKRRSSWKWSYRRSIHPRSDSSTQELKIWKSVVTEPDTYDRLVHNIDPTELKIHLPNILAQSEDQEISAISQQRGNIKAMEHLLLTLAQSANPEWPGDLLDALRQTRCEMYAQLLESCYKEAIKKKQRKSASSLDQDSAVLNMVNDNETSGESLVSTTPDLANDGESWV